MTKLESEGSSKPKKTIHHQATTDLDRGLAHALKTIGQATKKVKAFEIQRSIRKIRSARQPKPTRTNRSPMKIQLGLLEADLVALKAIVPGHLARKLLHARLKKKSSELSDHTTFQELEPSTESSTLGRIENKIGSHKLLAQVISRAVSSLLPHQPHPRALESLDTRAHPIRPSQTRRPTQAPSAQSSAPLDDRDRLAEELDQAVARELEALEDSDPSYTSDDESNQSSPEELERTILEEEGEPEDSIADSGDEDQGSLGGSEQARKRLRMTSSSKRLDPSTLDRSSGHSIKRSTTRSSASTFLPALNVGYTIGDSDRSSDSDIDDRALDKLERERARKNRRGQRARRAIWEQKYGKSAKHLTKLQQQKHRQPDQVRVRTQAYPSTRQRSEAIERKSDGDPKSKTKSDHDRKGGHRLKSTDSEDRSIVKKPDAHQVHPSWLAKQNQLKSLSAVKPTGKKIVFD